MSGKGHSNPSPTGGSSKGQSGGTSKSQSTPMTQSDASRIQSTQVWPFLIVTHYGLGHFWERCRERILFLASPVGW